METIADTDVERSLKAGVGSGAEHPQRGGQGTHLVKGQPDRAAIMVRARKNAGVIMRWKTPRLRWKQSG